MILMAQVIHKDGKSTIKSVSRDFEMLSEFNPETGRIDLSVLDNYKGESGILKKIYEEDDRREDVVFIVEGYDYDKRMLHIKFIDDSE